MEVESGILSIAIECKGYHERASEYGERAWRANGKNVDVVYWDAGNSWCAIMDVIPKAKSNQEKVIHFYKKLLETIDNCYDEDGYRMD